jgi:tryptophanyl-tRNA synthetase
MIGDGDMADKKRSLTGDRPTGRLHIGHYFGSLQNRVKMQEDDSIERFVMIADVQALTDNFNNPQKVRDNVYQVLLDYLSVGIDPEKTTIFLQSMVPELAELTVYYSNLVTIARLERNPTVKTEIAQKKDVFGESVTYGFLGYPVSQAADITAFEGELVPVGEDQLPLIEQCREIVRKFNSIYGETLKEPQAVLSSNKRIKGLDGNEKMGKSLGNAIYLSDSEEEITKKVMGAVTDPGRIKKDDLGNPDICMVAYYHDLFTNPEDVKIVCQECREGKRGCVACKKQLAANIIEKLRPIREKRKYYEERPELLDEILINGTKKAQEIAKETMRKVKANMKLNYFDK